MGFLPSHWNKINIHVNTTKGGKAICAERFIASFMQLDLNTQARLVIENDDKATQYSVQDLYDLLYKKISIPITFDVHHHKFCNSGLTHQQAAELAVSTWPQDVPACFHFASTINHEDASKMARAHADYIYDQVDDYGTGAWIMCECKAKEVALFEYLKSGVKNSNFLEIY